MTELNDDFRKWHYLRQLKSCDLPGHLLFYDTESFSQPDPEDPRREVQTLRLWSANYVKLHKTEVQRDVWNAGASIESFWDFVEKHTEARRPLWLVAHNCNFDLTLLGFWGKVADGTLEFHQKRNPRGKPTARGGAGSWEGFACLENPPFIAKCRFRGSSKTLVVVDSFNYFRTALADVGAAMGWRKFERPPHDAPAGVWQAYCDNDVRILRRIMLELVDFVYREQLGGLAFTCASQAMHAYRARFLQPKTICVHGSKDAIELERQCYMGGLAQQWFKGRVVPPIELREQLARDKNSAHDWRAGPVHVLDATAFYPSIMRAHNYPTRLVDVWHAPSKDQLLKLVENHLCCAFVKLDCDVPGYPVRRNGHTNYHIGRFHAYLCGPELMRALESGHIEKIHTVSAYEHAPIFRDWVDYLWHLRQQARKAGRPEWQYLTKLLANSLFGKFAQWSPQWQRDDSEKALLPLGFWYECDGENGKPTLHRSLGWMVDKMVDKREHNDSFPAISAMVCAYAREELLRWKEIAGPFNCLYSDTDSLHVLPAGLMRLRDAEVVKESEMGYLRLLTSADRATYNGPKDYWLGDRPTIAGIKHNARQLPDGSWEQENWQGVGTAMANPHSAAVVVKKVKILRETASPVGDVDRTGFVTPTRLDE